MSMKPVNVEDYRILAQSRLCHGERIVACDRAGMRWFAMVQLSDPARC
jgi:hypothetical protein